MRRPLGAALLGVMLLSGAALAQPVAPTLSGAVPSPAPPRERAHVLPLQVTVCIDRAAARCWTGVGADACAGGAVFGVTGASEQPGALLSRCHDSLAADAPR